MDIIDEIYSVEDDKSTVVFVTGMADIIVYDNEGYYIDIRHQKSDEIGDDEYFSLIREE
ncbi:MAG: hypothetical protein HFJ09_07410 [Lachnospiraceae bacterium]|nr:hypothetical protein [Lachnospiraceae bacterium]